MSYIESFKKFLRRELGLYYDENKIVREEFNHVEFGNMVAHRYNHLSKSNIHTYFMLDAGGNIWVNNHCLGPKN